jgi:hypothetical protein
VRTTLLVLAIIILAGCTVIYRSSNIDMHEDRNVTGTNRVTEVDLAPLGFQ